MDERPTLHLPDFEGSHLIGALHQVFPQLLQLLLDLWIQRPGDRETQRETDETETESERGRRPWPQ